MNSFKDLLHDAERRINIEKVPKFVDAILDPEDRQFRRLTCPRFDKSRYEYLVQKNQTDSNGVVRPTYLIALDLVNVAQLLPRLMGSIVEAVRFLGTENCVLSIIEGNSVDGTYEILDALRPEMKKLGLQYQFVRNEIIPNDGHRILHLAEFRNMALEPMLGSKTTTRFVEDDPVIIFLNDVALCPDDILELVHQRRLLGADMTCAMDWSHVKGRNHPTFYDVWVSRTVTGHSFFYIDPKDGSWDHSEEIFFDDDSARERFDSHRPVQVFACWNGAVVFSAKPLLQEGIRFRDGYKDECHMGEPTYLCKDFWKAGHGKIAVIPTVNLEYDDTHGKWIKGRMGFASDLVQNVDEQAEDFKIEWKGPPEKVLCMPGWTDQSWVPWDEHLP
jgi:alpha-1,3-mannosyltransferase